MLTYSGKGQFIRKPLQLKGMLSRLKDLVRASTSNNIQIDYQIDADLPAITADETQLDQIVLNLVINASESMSGQMGTITIVTGEEYLEDHALSLLSNGENVSSGNFVFLEVIDQGAGIAEHDRQRLFEPFYSTKFTGRGLGMAVLYGIVKGHDGAIKVTSEMGKGTSVRVYLPIGVTPVTLATQDATPLHPVPKGEGLVLIVEDEEGVRATITHMLETADYKVQTATNGKEGFAAFNRERAELVACVIDATMPELDGYGLIRRIQESGSNVPIVLVSGYQETQIDSGFDLSQVVFLQKPFKSYDLLHAIDTARSEMMLH